MLQQLQNQVQRQPDTSMRRRRSNSDLLLSLSTLANATGGEFAPSAVVAKSHMLGEIVRKVRDSDDPDHVSGRHPSEVAHKNALVDEVRHRVPPASADQQMPPSRVQTQAELLDEIRRTDASSMPTVHVEPHEHHNPVV